MLTCKKNGLGSFLALALSGLLIPGAPLVLQAQDPNDLLPAASAAKGKLILQEAVSALGGSAYVNARDLDCKGRIGQFDSGTGGAAGSFEGRFLRQFPDRSRTEVTGKNYLTNLYSLEINSKGQVVQVFTSESALSVGKGVITDLGPESVTDYKKQLKADLNMLLRYRLDEQGLRIAYSGSDVVDLKQVDWVEITDQDRETMRVAIDRNTHLPVRSASLSRDPATNERIETSRAYSNYHAIGGVQIPFQTSVFVNDRPASQTFYGSCSLNTGLSPELFTRVGLERQFPQKKK